jgi:hypothetical protein
VKKGKAVAPGRRPGHVGPDSRDPVGIGKIHQVDLPQPRHVPFRVDLPEIDERGPLHPRGRLEAALRLPLRAGEARMTLPVVPLDHERAGPARHVEVADRLGPFRQLEAERPPRPDGRRRVEFDHAQERALGRPVRRQQGLSRASRAASLPQ